VWRSPCGRTPFWKFRNNDKQHLGQCHWSHTAGLASDHLQNQTHAGLKGPNPKCRVDGQEVPSCSFQSFPHKDEYCGAACCCVAGWSFSSKDIFSAVHNEPSAAMDGNEQHWHYAHLVKTWQNAPFGIPKDSYRGIMDWDIIYGFLFSGDLVLCYSMLCYFVSGWKWWNQLFLCFVAPAYLYNLVNKAILVHNFSYYVYFFSLHVSGDCVLIIRRNNCIYAILGTCYSVWMTVWYARCNWFHPAYQTSFTA
jgi:hypothetical protein